MRGLFPEEIGTTDLYHLVTRDRGSTEYLSERTTYLLQHVLRYDAPSFLIECPS